jgi:TetR/AcrR family transcriptional repressor of mexJK operon
VIRSRAAVLEAAKTLFLEKGYAGTTMEDIADRAGIARRTVYNNYPDKEMLFRQIVADVLAYAERFARSIPAELSDGLTARELPAALHDFGRRLARGILRPEVIALRRLLIGETRNFPELPQQYFDRAPGLVMSALAARFAALDRAGALHTPDARCAAEQFAYLIVAMPLDRAMLVGKTPTNQQIAAAARAGVETFLARYASPPAKKTRRGG